MGDEPAARATRVAETTGHRRSMPVPERRSMDRAYPLLQLQQTIGNRAVQRLIQACPALPGACPTGGTCHTCPVRVQTRLTVGQPGDAYEQEADRVAERVMTMPEPRLQRQPEEEEEQLQAKPAGGITPSVQLQEAPQEAREEEGEQPVQLKAFSGEHPLLQRQGEEEEEQLQAKEVSGQAPEAHRRLESQINTMKGGGQPLPETVRTFFEPRFGYDFSQVRVHTGLEAAEAAKTANARAFTIGRELVFREGEYNPGTGAGKQLLAHELTHVVQQGGSRQRLQRQVMLNGSLMAPKQRSAFIKSDHWGGNSGLAREIMEDMADATDTFDFANENELKIEIKKRIATSRRMKESQAFSGGGLRAFGYPFTGDSLFYGPRVNYEAKDSWTPAVVDNYAVRADKAKQKQIRQLPRSRRYTVYGDPGSNYSWSLTPAGKSDPYEAIVKLFTPQPPHKRTLIHCDYLVSLVHFRSLADAVGKTEFNQRLVKFGLNNIRLKWNAFTDLNPTVTTVIGGLSWVRPGIGSLRRMRPSSERDLVIGDHVVFWNHTTYDLINAGTGNAWRLENAVLIGKTGGEDIFLGHGSGRKTSAQMKATLAFEYNTVAERARALIGTVRTRRRAKDATGAAEASKDLENRFNVKEVGGKFKIQGLYKFCNMSIDQELRLIRPAEVTGLKDPCNPTQMNWVERPVESAP